MTNPILTAGDVTDVKAEYVADPFLVIDDLQYYLFFEVLNHTDGQGDIGLAESMDGKTWRYRQVVLDEPFHLSYPYVFKWQGAYYMIPESAKDQSVRLYQAVDFPLRWKLVKKLLSGASFVDSSVVYFQDRWWMFTYVTGENALELYKADDLSGTWTAHPMSPLTRGNKHISRPAGRLLVWQNRLYRFAQDDAPLYGQQVFAFEVTKLTAADYQEIPVSDTPLVKSSDGAWAVTAMHQVDLHWMGESGWLVAVDGYIP